MEQRTPQPPQKYKQESNLETIQKSNLETNRNSGFCFQDESAPSETLPYFCLNPHRRLDALLSRSVFYELAEHAEFDARNNLFFVRSGEDRFALTTPQ